MAKFGGKRGKANNRLIGVARTSMNSYIRYVAVLQTKCIFWLLKRLIFEYLSGVLSKREVKMAKYIE